MSASGEMMAGDDLSVRLVVLEMTIAAVAARLPQADLEEIASMLVFVAQGTDVAGGFGGEDGANPVRHYATEMLERIAKSRRPSTR